MLAGRSRRPTEADSTGLQLATALRCGLRSVDRLIASGLRPVGARGRARLYHIADARRLAHRLARRDQAPADVLIADYRSHAEDLHDRRCRLLAEWIADATWVPAWRAVVAAMSAACATWPARLVDRLGAVTPDEAALLPWADGPHVAPPAPRRYLTADDVRAMLAGDPAAYPWRPAATRAIAALAADGSGIELRDDGAWIAWAPAHGIPEPMGYPAAVMRPLLQDLADAVPTMPAWRALAEVLAVPRRPRRPTTPTTVEGARGHWRQARSAYRRVRVAVRRGHHRRERLHAAILEAAAEHQGQWLGAPVETVAGDPVRVREWATRLDRETLARFARLGGLAPTTGERTS